METAQDDSCSNQAPSILLLTGRLLPASLKIAGSYRTSDHDTWDRNGLRIEVNSDFLKGDSKSTWLTRPEHGSCFYKDFEIRTAGSDCDTQYDVSIVQLGTLQLSWPKVKFDHCLVLWRYGRGIPGSGLERETVEKHSIYQRIGMLEIEDSPEGDCTTVDWSKVEEVTIAIE
jgi:hypothetical protein